MPPASARRTFYLLPELVLTAGALLLLGVDLVTPRNRQGVLAWVSLGIIAATALAVAPIATANVTVSRGLIAVDGFGLFFKVVFLLSAAVTILMSAPYLQVEGARAGEYFLILCATLGMMFMAGGIDLITIFIGLETMAVSFYILTGYIKPDRRSNEAAVKYFLLGAFSLGILLYGMSRCAASPAARIFGRLPPSSRPAAAAACSSSPSSSSSPASDSRSRPCRSMWAPDVYEGAPTPVTAFLRRIQGRLVRDAARDLPRGAAGVRLVRAGRHVRRAAWWTTFFYILAVITMTVGNWPR